MSIRLQVLMDEAELDEIRGAAAQQHMTVAEWVRQALRAARRDGPRIAQRRKLEALRAAVAHDFPTADIDVMLAQIERSQLGPEPE